MSGISISNPAGGSGGGGGKLLAKAESYLLWDNSGNGKNLGGTFSWLGDPIGNNPMMVLVVDHSIHPTIHFHIWGSITEDGTVSTGTFEWSIWDDTHQEMVLYRQQFLPANQWRGLADVSQIFTHPKGRGAGVVEYRLHAKTSIGGLELRGSRVDSPSYTGDYHQYYGFEARSAA